MLFLRQPSATLVPWGPASGLKLKKTEHRLVWLSSLSFGLRLMLDVDG